MLPPNGLWVRISPTVNRDWDVFKIDQETKTIHVRSPEDLRRKRTPNNLYWQFKVDEILEIVSQEQCYDSICSNDLITNILNGYSLTIIGFGSSETGKTYTLFGPSNNYQYRGIVPRLMEAFFHYKDEEVYQDVTISLKFVEIFEKEIYNLLKEGKPKVDRHVAAVNINDLCESFKLVQQGNCRRKFENLGNHCGTAVCSIVFSKRPKSQSVTSWVTSVINVVDTGGTEFGRRATKSMKCRVNANLVKSQLSTISSWTGSPGTCRDPNFRSSTLAMYLGEALNVGFVRLLAHVAGSREAIPAAISTLLFGSRLAKLPSPRLVQAKLRDPGAYVQRLQSELFEAKAELSLRETLGGIYQPNVATQGQMRHAFQLVKSFLNSEIPSECVVEIAHPTLLLHIFKDIYDSATNETQAMREELASLKMEHDTMRHKNPDFDNKQKSLRKKISLTSIKSKKEIKKKKSVLTRSGDVSLESETTVRGEDRKKHFELSQQSIVDGQTGEDNFQRTFAEFLVSNQELKNKITYYKQDMDDSFKLKVEVMNEMTALRHKLKDLELALEDEKWKCELKGGELGFDRHGKRMTKSPTQEVVECEMADVYRALNRARKNAINAHTAYMASSNALKELLLEAERWHNHCTKDVYSSSLVIPPVDMFNGISSLVEDAASSTKRIRDCYEHDII